VKQHDLTDCGPACLRAVARWHGLEVSHIRLRQLSATNRAGTTLLGLVDAASHLGFACKGVRCADTALEHVPTPAIAHVTRRNAGHFVVVTRVSNDEVCIMDPADGSHRAVDRADFRAEWSGVLVLLAPGDHFASRHQRDRGADGLLQLTRRHSQSLIAIGVVSVAATVLGFSSALYLQRLLDHALADRRVSALASLTCAVSVAVVLQAGLSGIKSALALRLGRHIDARLLFEYVAHLFRLPQAFFDEMRTGEIISRITDVVKVRAFVTEIAIDVQVNVVVILIGASVLLHYQWRLAVLTLCALPCFALVGAVSNHFNSPVQRQILARGDDLEAQLVESLNAVPTIRRLGLEAHTNDVIQDRFNRLLDASFRGGVHTLGLGVAAQMTARTYSVATLWVAARLVVDGRLTVGQLVSSYAVAAGMATPMMALIGAHKAFRDAAIAAHRLFDIFDLEPEDADVGADLGVEPHGDIELHHVHFAYLANLPALEDVSMRIAAGSLTAIVGESGSGKTSIASLLQRIYEPQRGGLTIRGISLRDVSLRCLRRSIGVVPQHVQLFAGSLTDNITVGDPSPDPVRVHALCSELGIDRLAERGLNGMRGHIAENGGNLSGGERQRIAIARALYPDPAILVLDEATAALDAEAAHLVQACVRRLREEGKTIVVITHHLMSIADADQIIVMARGRVIEHGTHSELIDRRGLYARMLAERTTERTASAVAARSA
ncbi:MAG TPA: peptidase domain-containing ABC transporter, partial [Gemmatimonadaceae bacterium]